MHANVRSASQGKCPVCGMALVAPDARFPTLEHALGNRVHLAVMAVVVIALIAGTMMFLR